MGKKDRPDPKDDLKTAEAKSKSVDERIPEHVITPPTLGRVHTGAPAAQVAQAGIGTPLDRIDEEPGEGELVLDQERKAQRSGIQRG